MHCVPSLSWTRGSSGEHLRCPVLFPGIFRSLCSGRVARTPGLVPAAVSGFLDLWVILPRPQPSPCTGRSLLWTRALPGRHSAED